MEYELTNGQAMIIIGPQGCGKTILARKIAEKYGSFVEVDAGQLETCRGLKGIMLASDPKTVICDGFPTGTETQARLKTMIASDTMIYEGRMVKMPNFIFCIADTNPLSLTKADKRFRVIELGTSSWAASNCNN